MSDDFSEITERWQRLRWARIRAGFARATDAAQSLSIKPGTYRTYEQPPGDGGREPPLTEIQRMARKFKVGWVWLAVGEGGPDDGGKARAADDRVGEISDKVSRIPPEKRDDAINAAVSVLDSFIRSRRS